MDKTDKKLLDILQNDATLSVGAMAEAVHLSTTACWKRIQNLEERGVIRKRVALLDPAQLKLGMTVFVTVKTNHHDLQWLQAFSQVVRDMPEVVEFYRMSGEVDYLLRIVVPDIQAYDQVYKRLIKDTRLSDVSSSFAMEELKNTTALPLDFV
ncbi:Lrp/AsnC family transcriptional regulator [Candidimonas nitroreducens]|uniref:Transcriptional regulator n=1 Tax=Candidimonas nitroreducens TaxID=683354 RepID=A0A225M8H1_9BURK|nr:Lrp/AsnC family transcriptional regulator [Candidimonas nitroreducens]OWT57644.1 transcriptional regulator [Candidimonas nitroreducens]